MKKDPHPKVYAFNLVLRTHSGVCVCVCACLLACIYIYIYMYVYALKVVPPYTYLL